MSSTIASLPDEILIAILKRLPQCSYYTAVLVSKRFNRLSIPFLYQEFHYSQDVSGKLWNFVHIVKKNPKLANHVHRVSLHSSCESHGQSKAIIQALARQEYVKTPTCCSGGDCPSRPNSLGLQILLRYLPSVRSLYVYGIVEYEHTVGNFILPGEMTALRGTDVMGCFKTLTNINVKLKSPSWPAIKPFFGLPSLKSLTIRGRDDPSLYTPFKQGDELDFSPRSSSIESLSFQRTSISVNTLICAVESCKTLAHFHYFGPSSNEINTFYPALYKHQDTIRTLDIAGGWEKFERYFVLPVKRFHQLQHLGLIYNMVQVDELPRGLRTLTLHATTLEATSLLVEDLGRLAQQLSAKLDRQTEVKLNYLMYYSDHTIVRLKNLPEYFQDCGIQLSLYVSPAEAIEEYVENMVDYLETQNQSLEGFDGSNLEDFQLLKSIQWYRLNLLGVPVIIEEIAGTDNLWDSTEWQKRISRKWR